MGRAPTAAGLAIVVLLAACQSRGLGDDAEGGPRGSVGAPSASSKAESARLSQRELIAGTKAVHFLSADGVRLAGRLFGRGTTAVILSHMGPDGNDQSQWWPFARVLADKGYLVLTYDYSGICPGGPAGCSRGRTTIAAPAPNLLGAMRFVESRGATKVVLGGASMGAMASLRVAARPDVSVAAVVSVSGIELLSGPYELGRDVITGIDEPKLFLAGEFDQEAAASARDWIGWSKPPKAGRILDTGLHGTDMFNLASGDDADVPGEVTDEILVFLDRFAPAVLA